MTKMSQRTWLSLITEADPDFNSDENVRTREYKFAGRREFRGRPGNWYSSAGPAVQESPELIQAPGPAPAPDPNFDPKSILK